MLKARAPRAIPLLLSLSLLLAPSMLRAQVAQGIRVSCVGEELSLSVNGLPQGTVTDSAFAGGDVGLGVSTLEPGTAVVQFDDLLVLAP